MLADTTLELAKHKNIAGIKEACGDLNQTGRIASLKTDDFMLISGDDMLTSAMMEQGAIGAISVLANGFPEEYSSNNNCRFEQTIRKIHKSNASV